MLLRRDAIKLMGISSIAAGVLASTSSSAISSVQAAGLYVHDDLIKPNSDFIPDDVTWIKDQVASFIQRTTA